jgi:hypothetical protein
MNGEARPANDGILPHIYSINIDGSAKDLKMQAGREIGLSFFSCTLMK